MTKIKICGLNRDIDITYANEAAPDYCGFIIDFPKSHRNVSPDRVRELTARLSGDITPVGVFVDEDIDTVASLLNDGTIKVAQLHGHEDDEYIEKLRKACPGAEIWKAFKIRSEDDLKAAAKSTADRVLLDNGYGTGACFDWTLVGDFSREFILAGGLTPDNISEAIRQMKPSVIDISSGVETDKLKDINKMLAAVRAAREGDK